MIKTIILDSNIEIINYFKAFFKMAYPSIKVVSFMQDSTKNRLFELIESKKPRLIIMDIRFFAFLSFSIIEDIRNKYPKIKIIVLGEYSDYDYMKKSLEYGAMDFIIKPIKPKELDKTFGKIIAILDSIDKEEIFEKQIIKNYNDNIDYFKNIFIDNILNGKIRDKEEIINSISYFNLPFKAPYLIAYIGIDNFREKLKKEIKDNYLLVCKVFYIVQKYFDDNNLGFARIDNSNSICCFISQNSDLKKIFYDFDNIKSEINIKLGIATTIGIGRIKEEADQINISAKEALSALRHKNFIGRDSIIPIDFVEIENNSTYNYLLEKENTLAYSAIFGDYDFTSQIISQIINSLGDNLPDRLLSKIIMGIVISISRYSSEMGFDIEARFRDFFDFSKVFELKSKEDAKIFLNNALKQFCEYMNEIRKNKDEIIFKKIKNHIEENYHSNINFKELSFELKITVKNMMDIFFKNMGNSINDYISILRIKKAKEIIKNDDNYDEEALSNFLGYKDPRHFKSTFKKQEGIYPNEYRIEIKV